MDPFSIVVSIATLLELGLRVSKEVDSVIRTWKSCSPVIMALSNEVSDLVVVLDHIYAAQESVRAKGEKHDHQFIIALESNLVQTEDLLHQLATLLVELKALSSLKRKYKWQRKQYVAEDLQRRLRMSRLRINELLIAHNVSSVSRIELQLREVHATVQRNHQTTIDSIKTVGESTNTLNYAQYNVYHRDGKGDRDVVVALAKTLAWTDDQTQLGSSIPAQRQARTKGLEASRRHSRAAPACAHIADPASDYLRRGGAGLTNPVSTVGLTGGLAQGLADGLGTMYARYCQVPVVHFVAQRPRFPCRQDCVCQCHSNGKWRLTLRSAVLGRLFVGYSGAPSASEACDYHGCLARGHLSIEVSYVFPTWLLSYAISAFFMQTGSGGPNLGLFVTKRIPWELGNILVAASNGNAESLMKCLRADPFCIHYGFAEDGRTALQFAIYNRNWEAARFLIAHGANPDAKDDLGDSPAALVAIKSLMPYMQGREDQEALNSAFETDKIRSNLPFLQKIILGICHGDITSILHNPDETTQVMLHELDEQDTTPLFWAVVYRDVAAVRALIRAGANIERGSGETVSPLQRAMHVPGPEADVIVDELIEAGANIHWVDDVGFQPIHWACRGNNVHSLDRLISLGADANLYTVDSGVGGAFPTVHIASTYDSLEALEYLLNAGANIDGQPKDYETPIYTSIMFGGNRCLEFLITHGAKLRVGVAPRTDATNILHVAAQFGNEKTLDILAGAPICAADLEAPSRAGFTPGEMFERREEEDEEVRAAWERLVKSIQERGHASSEVGDDPGSSFSSQSSGLETGGGSGGESDSSESSGLAEDYLDESDEDDEGDVFYDALDTP